ncbi:MAG TPA: ATP-binding cassette domain-containing protein [Streptosporangiaceae bacterium]|nr:ATP-binding cassette domain-containing protein [Streptosporangiaceae bacterium]
MSADVLRVLAAGRSRHVGQVLLGSLVLGVAAGAASVGLLALSGWFIAMSALAGAGLAAGFSFFYPSAGVQALAFGRTAIRYVERLTGHTAALRLDAAVKETVFAAAITPPGRGSAEERTGVLLHAVTSDAQIAENSLLRVASPVITYAGVLCGGCAVIATISPALAAVIAAGGVAMAAIVVLPAWTSSLRPGRRLAMAEQVARQDLVDALDGLDELVSFGAQALAAARAADLLAEAERAGHRLRVLAAVSRALAAAMAGGTVLLVAALASGTLGQRPTGSASAAAVTLAALGILQLSDPLAGAARDVGRTRAVWARLSQVLPQASHDTQVGESAASESLTGAGLAGTDLAGTIIVAGLSIDRGRGVIVGNLNFRAAPGQTVLLNGPSGAGKTSILAALAGQIQAGPGQVRVAGKVVCLPQQPYAFRGTTADNLRLADPEASDDRLREALTIAGLDDVLGTAALEQRIGLGGRALSGGQLRRLTIAQALLARPGILLADEPTEGLDSQAARELLLALRESDLSMTLVLALHDQQLGQLSWTPDTIVRLPA